MHADVSHQLLLGAQGHLSLSLVSGERFMDPKGIVNTCPTHMILLCTDGQAILSIAILNFNCCIKILFLLYLLSGEQMLSVFSPKQVNVLPLCFGTLN